MPFVSRTRAIFRSAEFGFFGVIVDTRVQTPRRCGAPWSAGVFVFSRLDVRPLRMSWFTVGIAPESLVSPDVGRAGIGLVTYERPAGTKAPAEPRWHGSKEVRAVNRLNPHRRALFGPSHPCRPMRLEHSGHVVAAMLILAAALVGALALVARSIAATAGLRRTLDDRVSAEAGKIAGEWASRAELAASLDQAALTERTLSGLAALPSVDAAVMLVGDEGAR